MCDDDIHPGLMVDPTLSRRTFGLAAGAAAGLAALPAWAAVPVVEKDVEIKTPDGTSDAAFFHPEGAGSWPGVLLWTDIAGLRPVFRQMAKRLASEGYAVLVPNVYYRTRKAPVVGATFNFATDRAQLPPRPSDANIAMDTPLYIAFLDAQPQVNKAKKLGVQGYCMGGPYAFRTAEAVPGRLGAVASFHGGGLATNAPTSPHQGVAKTQAQYLVAIAANDDRQDPTAKDKLKAAFEAAKRPNVTEVYAGADHGWTVEGSAAYNKDAAEKAWAELLALYKRAIA